MADKMNKFEKRLRSARLGEEQLDPFRQIVARLPKDWIHTKGFDLAAGMALRVKSGPPVFAPVARLFKIANLDYEIPWHWPILLALIAWCSSEESRGRGAKTKWTSKKMNELRSDLATLKSTKNKSLMAKNLRKKFPDKYGKLEEDYLRKVISRALLAEASASLGTTPRSVADKEKTTADTINDIVTVIKTEIEDEEALLKFEKDRPLDSR